MTTWDLPAGSGARWVDDYDQGRPGWPDEVATHPGLSPSSVVLDLAAGSGKLTQILRGHFREVIAVEPQPLFRSMLHDRMPDLDVRDGTAQSLPLDHDALDAVFVGQAFHWFADRAALDEIGRVLRPTGKLVLMWNVPRGPWEPSTADAERLLLDRAPAVGGGVDPLDFSVAHATEWEPVVQASTFGPIHDAVVPNLQTLTVQGLIAYYASMGWLADLPDTEREPLLAGATARLTAERYQRPWETLLFWTARDG